MKEEVIIQKLDKLIKMSSKRDEEQLRKEMKRQIKRASNRKILRRQMELLTECSRVDYQDFCPMPESSQAIASLHGELIKAECILLVRILIAFLGLFHLVKSIPIKGIQFIKG